MTRCARLAARWFCSKELEPEQSSPRGPDGPGICCCDYSILLAGVLHTQAGPLDNTLVALLLHEPVIGDIIAHALIPTSLARGEQGGRNRRPLVGPECRLDPDRKDPVDRAAQDPRAASLQRWWWWIVLSCARPKAKGRSFAMRGHHGPSRPVRPTSISCRRWETPEAI